MLRGQKVFFRASKGVLDRLYTCNRESARVWNEYLRLTKEHFLQHGCWITKSELQNQTKRKFHLHSESIQAVCLKYLFARQSAHHAIQQGHAARYPYKKKKYLKQSASDVYIGNVEIGSHNHLYCLCHFSHDLNSFRC